MADQPTWVWEGSDEPCDVPGLPDPAAGPPAAALYRRGPDGTLAPADSAGEALAGGELVIGPAPPPVPPTKG